MRSRTIIIIAVILLLAVGIGGYIYLKNSEEQKTIAIRKEAGDTSYNHVYDEYLKLFNFPDKDSLKAVVTNENRFRNPVSGFVYHGAYFQVYKMGNAINRTLKNLLDVKIIKRDENGTANALYDITDLKYYQVGYKLHTAERAFAIHFTLYGDKTKALAQNDSLVYFQSNLNNFSISYNDSPLSDIYCNSKYNYNAITMASEVLFLKRKGNLYFLLMTPADKSTQLKSGALYSYIGK